MVIDVSSQPLLIFEGLVSALRMQEMASRLPLCEMGIKKESNHSIKS